MMLERKCVTRYCRNKAAPQRIICYCCKQKQYRKTHPVRSAYISLKSNVKVRAKKFKEKCGYDSPKYKFVITFEEFKEFCIETEILMGRGRMADSWHIDRIDEGLGYYKGNLQKLTNSQNIKKSNKLRKRVQYDYLTGEGQTVIEMDVREIEFKDVPF